MVQRIYPVQESDLRMLGDLARNIQRVLPVTQADIDAAAALGQGWVVERVVEVSAPLDNMRGGTQLVIKQNSITPGQNVRRVLIVSGPGGEKVIVGPGVAPLSLPDAIADSLTYVKAYGGTEQRNLPDNYIERQFVYMMDGSYLLTDIVPTYDGHYEMDFQTTSLPSKSVYFLGGRTEVYGGLFFAQGGEGTVIVDAFNNIASSRYTSSVSLENNTRYKFVYDNQVSTLTSGGTTLFTNTSTGALENGATLVINGLNNNGTVTGGQAGIYLYSFKVWNGQGELVANYVPAVQKGTVPVVGFYDTVSKTFKTATAGTFAAGGEAVPTPDAPMDIVSNNGVVKVSQNLFDKNDSGVGNGYVSASTGAITGSTRGHTGYFRVKPNTTYSVTLDTYQVDSTNGIAFYDNDKNFVAGLTSRDSYGYSPHNFTVPNNNSIVYARLTLTDNIANTNLDVIQIEQGSVATQYRPYGATYTDGTVETIWARGKNLWDGKAYRGQLSQGRPYIVNNTEVTSPFTSPTGYSGVGIVVKVIPGQQYCFSSDVTNAQYKHVGFYANREDVTDYSKNISYTTSPTVTAPAGANYAVCCYVNATSGTEFNWTWIQAELGSTATDYEPYYDGGTATAEMLLKVGDYTDVQSIIDGVVTRNVGVKVLNGTESWNTYSVTQGTLFRTQIADSVSNAKESLGVLCNAYQVVASGNRTSGTLTGSATNYDFINDDYTTDTSWKQYLADQYAAGTPVIIVYPLATETTESVAGQTLQVTDGDNVLEITQASLSGLELEAEYTKRV